MTESIATYWNDLQNAKKDFESIIDSMTPEQRHRKPEDAGWSALQVVEHILFSETGTLGYMMKKTSSGWESLENEEDEHSTNGKQLINRLKSEEKYKAPSILPEPSGDVSWADLQSKWNETRIHFEKFLIAFDPRFQKKLVFKQPYAGMITLENTLQFLSSHIQHHIPQIVALSRM